jgi:hypothetical protein
VDSKDDEKEISRVSSSGRSIEVTTEQEQGGER